ncbi:unnamed protein product, partial [Lymnaea stagnalis]
MMNYQHTHEDGFVSTFFTWFRDVTSTHSGLAIVTIIVFIASILMEALASAMRRLHSRPLFWIRSRQMTSSLHNVLATLVHAAEMALMLSLMVVFMTLNLWLCVAIIVGSALGYMMFNWRST